MYRLLFNVNGIGPKAGLSVFSVMSADDLRLAVIADDAKAIAKAPGVGTKTAQRIILELKDKLSLEDALKRSWGNQVPSETMPLRQSQSEDRGTRGADCAWVFPAEALRA